MKFESYEEYIVDRLKQLSKQHPDTVYYWAERDDYEGGMDYFMWKENYECISEEEDVFVNEGSINSEYHGYQYTLPLDEDMFLSGSRVPLFKFKNGVVYAPNEEI